MTASHKQFSPQRNRDGEQGAALVMVLLVTMLLLVGGAAILTLTAKSSANVTDAAANEQAYYAAESGLQEAINVLRGNKAPNPLFHSSAPHPDNQISYRKALSLSQSNLQGDASSLPRLSRWMNYSGDRVTMGSSAYAIELSDPDQTNSLIDVSVTAKIAGSTSVHNYGIGTIGTIDFVENAHVNVSPGAAEVTIGGFVITAASSIPLPVSEVPFEINVTINQPIQLTRTLRGKITRGSIGRTSADVKIDFDSPGGVEFLGSTLGINSDHYNSSTGEVTPNAPNTSGGRTDIRISLGLLEPRRMLIRATGYGPRGAKKQLEAIVQKDLLNGCLVPAALTLVGTGTGAVLDLGHIGSNMISGQVVGGSDNMVVPAIGTTSGNTSVINSILSGSILNNITGASADVTAQLSSCLQSAANLDKTVKELKNAAIASGTYYQSGVNPTAFGNSAAGKGVTFVDGDATLEGAGGGILVCTGKLTLKRDYNFNGLIIVTGAGGVVNQGRGEGVIQGNLLIAPYNPNDLTAGFLSPKFDLRNAASSSFDLFASLSLNGTSAANTVVVGVVEK